MYKCSLARCTLELGPPYPRQSLQKIEKISCDFPSEFGVLPATYPGNFPAETAWGARLLVPRKANDHTDVAASAKPLSRGTCDPGDDPGDQVCQAPNMAPVARGDL